MRHAITILLLGVTACASAPPSISSSAPANAEASAEPDRGKLRAHLHAHVKYPATRAELLAACADTPEFTAGQREWFAGKLPEGTYASPTDVLAAVGD